MSHEPPPKNPRRPTRPTRPVSLRMDVELLERLEHHAPLQRRSVGNLLQTLVAEGLDRLDDEERRSEVVKNARQLLERLSPEEAKQMLKRQEEFFRRVQGEPPGRLEPLPPWLRGGGPLPPTLRGKRPRPPRKRRKPRKPAR